MIIHSLQVRKQTPERLSEFTTGHTAPDGGSRWIPSLPCSMPSLLHAAAWHCYSGGTGDTVSLVSGV